jgi:hypothetical protein
MCAVFDRTSVNASLSPSSSLSPAPRPQPLAQAHLERDVIDTTKEKYGHRIETDAHRIATLIYDYKS